MDLERWQKLSPLLDALLGMEPRLRAEHLQTLRQEDSALADELQALLALEADDQQFLAEPVVELPLGAHPGAHVGPYLLERLLGEGGMGQVWLAQRADGLYERRVAVKLLRPGLADPSLTIRFVRERQILARLTHPHIARLLDAGIDREGKPYLALEYVDGSSIIEWCRQRALSVPARLDLFRQVCDAVSHAHANLIVHRDLKPSNILVTPDGNVRLLDFGIAKLLDNEAPLPEQTRTGTRTFTLYYAAPEQIRGEPVTTMTDGYSLGVVLYELLCGTRPYRLKRQTDAEWEEAILDGEPIRPSSAAARAEPELTRPYTPARLSKLLSGDLDKIVLKALAKHPEQRYASVEALSLDLQRYLRGQAVQARGQALGYRVRKYVSRHRWPIAAAIGVLATMFATLGIVSWQARQAVREAARAQAMQDFIGALLQDAEARGKSTPLDVRELLTLSADRGDRALAAQPEAQAELLGMIARLRLRLGDYVEAASLLQRQAGLLAQVPDPPTGLRLEAASLNGMSRRQLGHAQQCIEVMQPLLSTAQREASLLPARAAEFLTVLGRCHRDIGDRNLARQLLTEALALRRDVLQDPPGVAETLTSLAVLRAENNEVEAAMADLRQAMAGFRGDGGDQHPYMVEMLRQLCAWERGLGLAAQAERNCMRGVQLAVALHGEDNAATTDARTQLGALYVDEGRLREADAQFSRSLGSVQRRMGPAHPQLGRLYNSMAIVAWEQGDLAAADARVRQAIDILRKTDNTGLLAALLYNRALMLHSAGRNRDALPPLHEARQLRVARFGADNVTVAGNDRLQAEVELALGQPAALDRLRGAVAVLEREHGRTHVAARRGRIALLRALAMRGDAQARAGLQREAGIAAPHDGEQRRMTWLARGYLADVDCAAGNGNRAAADALLAEIDAAMPEGGSLRRELAAIRARCAAPTTATAAAPAR